MIRPPLALVAAAAVAALYAILNPVHDTDVLWQAKLGDLIIEHGGPLWTEPFYLDAAGRPVIVHNVLSQLWYASIRKSDSLLKRRSTLQAPR